MIYNLKAIPLDMDRCNELNYKIMNGDIIMGQYCLVKYNREYVIYKLFGSKEVNTGLITMNLYNAIMFMIRYDSDMRNKLNKLRFDVTNITIIKHNKVSIK